MSSKRDKLRSFTQISFKSSNCLSQFADGFVEITTGFRFFLKTFRLREKQNKFEVTFHLETEVWVSPLIRDRRGCIVRIQLLDERGRSYYEAFEGRQRMIIPFDVASIPPGTYTVDVSTPTACQRQLFVIEPPAPKRVRLTPDRPEPDWVVTTDLKLRRKQ